MEALNLGAHGFAISRENASNYSAVDGLAVFIFLWQVLNINHFDFADVINFDLTQIITIIFNWVYLNRVHVLEKRRVVELNIVL